MILPAFAGNRTKAGRIVCVESVALSRLPASGQLAKMLEKSCFRFI